VERARTPAANAGSNAAATGLTPLPDAELDDIAAAAADVTGEPLSGADSLMVRHHKSRITRCAKTTPVARSTHDLQLPLHSAKVPLADIDAIRAAMTRETMKRYDDVYALTFFPRGDDGKDMAFDNDAAPSQWLPERDADQLVTDGIIEFVNDEHVRRSPTRGAVTCFTVKEHKTTELLQRDGTRRVVRADRRRFIAWPRKQNDWLQQSGYRCEVDLEHVSAYLYDVTTEAATSGDCKLGFWQTPIPMMARALFRGRDASGRLFQLRCMPMGVRTAVELQQKNGEVLVGMQGVVRPPLVLTTRKTTSVFVDGFRAAGSAGAMKELGAKIASNAATYRITLKAPPTVDKSYDYVGVSFDHVQHRVRVAPKTRAKLERPLQVNVSYGELERFIGVLFFGSAVCQKSLVAMWFAIKFVRRRLAELNNGKRHDGVAVTDASRFDLPRGVWCALEQRRAAVLDWHTIVPITGRGSAHLFVDASMSGAGGVLLRPNGSIGVVGRRWNSEEASQHITALEARAASWVVDEFGAQLDQYAEVTLHIDNSAVQHAVRSGNSRSDAVAQEVADLVRKMHRSVRWFVVRVASDDNPADAPSRQLYVEYERLRAQAQMAANTRSGQERASVSS
jgi:hypothetical protein